MDNYKVVSPASPMNGSWSPAVRPESDNGMGSEKLGANNWNLKE